MNEDTLLVSLYACFFCCCLNRRQLPRSLYSHRIMTMTMQRYERPFFISACCFCGSRLVQLQMEFVVLIYIFKI